MARDLWLGHDVALKLLKANVSDRARMLQEARMLVRVRHINVVMVHGADVHGGRLGFWMDFVEGVTLHDAIHREGPRSASEAFAWGQDLCRALAAVHNAGIVHRDVKAQNVMRRTSDGRLVLMDFGAGELLGAARGGRRRWNAAVSGARTAATAPRRPAARTSTRWASCCSSSSPASFPFRRDHLGRAARGAHARRDRVRLEDVRPDMPAAFVDVVERALRPDPSQRYASAGEMLAAMRSGDESGPLHVTPVPSPTPDATSVVAADGPARWYRCRWRRRGGPWPRLRGVRCLSSVPSRAPTIRQRRPEPCVGDQTDGASGVLLGLPAVRPGHVDRIRDAGRRTGQRGSGTRARARAQCRGQGEVRRLHGDGSVRRRLHLLVRMDVVPVHRATCGVGAGDRLGSRTSPARCRRRQRVGAGTRTEHGRRHGRTTIERSNPAGAELRSSRGDHFFTCRGIVVAGGLVASQRVRWARGADQPADRRRRRRAAVRPARHPAPALLCASVRRISVSRWPSPSGTSVASNPQARSSPSGSCAGRWWSCSS